MTLQSSGSISINQIRTELGSGSYSLRTLSAAAGKSTPDSMSEFYGYSAGPPSVFSVSASSLSGNTWSDLSGNNNNMTLINGPYYSNVGGGSVYFDGSNDRAEATDSASLSITSSLTIIAWIYPTAATNSCGFIVKGNYNVYDWDYMFYISANSTALVGYKKNSSGTAQAVGGYNPAGGMINKWNHVAFVISGGTAAALYHNTTQGATATFTSGIRDSSVPLTIGHGYNNLFPGYIGSVKIYNFGFTSTEITADYNATKSKYGL
jgi:hypothetical protein